jgi:hypothetical protein
MGMAEAGLSIVVTILADGTGCNDLKLETLFLCICFFCTSSSLDQLFLEEAEDEIEDEEDEGRAPDHHALLMTPVSFVALSNLTACTILPLNAERSYRSHCIGPHSLKRSDSSFSGVQ